MEDDRAIKLIEYCVSTSNFNYNLQKELIAWLKEKIDKTTE